MSTERCLCQRDLLLSAGHGLGAIALAALPEASTPRNPLRLSRGAVLDAAELPLRSTQDYQARTAGKVTLLEAICEQIIPSTRTLARRRRVDTRARAVFTSANARRISCSFSQPKSVGGS